MGVADARTVPPWARGEWELVPAGPHPAQREAKALQWQRRPGFSHARSAGLVVCAFDALPRPVSLEAGPLAAARELVAASRGSPLDLGVFAFADDADLAPEQIVALADEQIVVARTPGRDARERAEAFVAEHRDRAQVERENFAAFAAEADALRQRLGSSGRG